MTTFTATYSPDDNKIRLSASSRLDAETYDRIKAAGFAWAPKQERFIAPMWTPARADLCIELAGEIEDDDGSLIERAEDRAERFEDYRDKRGAEADRALDHVHRIADGIPLGQPILVGHHSERRARKDAERIESGMRKAVQLFDTAEYWKRRAASAIAHAKYKLRPDVRHRRIKGIEADQRKNAKELDECLALARLWSKIPRQEWDKQTAAARFIAGRTTTVSTQATDAHPYGSSLYSELDAGRMHGDTAWRLAVAQCERRIASAQRWADHYANRLEYERAMLADGGGIAAERFDIQPGGRVLVRGEWLVVLRLNKSGGQVVSVTTNAQYVRVKGIEEIKDYRAPDPEDAAKVAKVSKLAPMCNYPGEGFRELTRAEWENVHKDYRGSRDLGVGAKPNRWGAELDSTQSAAIAAGQAPHRLRSMVRSGSMVYVYLIDAKRTDPPMVGDRPKGASRGPWSPKAGESAAPAAQAEPVTFERQREPAALPLPTHSAPPAGDSQAATVAAMRESLRIGVQVVSAPQLFPTPPELAARMVELANITPASMVLEPSAGTGRLVDAIMRQVPHSVDAVEINRSLAGSLQARHAAARVKCADFLALEPKPGQHDGRAIYDAIVMNPPFANGADVDHVTHAARFLAPGGRLVAIMSAGVEFRDDRKTREFRALVRHMDGVIEPLPEGTFESSGTGVRTVLVVLDAPGRRKRAQSAAAGEEVAP